MEKEKKGKRTRKKTKRNLARVLLYVFSSILMVAHNFFWRRKSAKQQITKSYFTERRKNMFWTDVFANESRQKVLYDSGIAFTVDRNLNFGFYSEKDANEAYRLLKEALA